jgi:hypothetical protein
MRITGIRTVVPRRGAFRAAVTSLVMPCFRGGNKQIPGERLRQKTAQKQSQNKQDKETVTACYDDHE